MLWSYFRDMQTEAQKMLSNLPKNLESDVLIQSPSFFPRVFRKFTYRSKYLSAYYYRFSGPSSDDSDSVVGEGQKSIH